MNVKIREEGTFRLYPPVGSPRYYYLNCLRKELLQVCELYFQKKKDLVVTDYGCGNMPYESIFRQFTSNYIGIDLPENPRAHIHIDVRGKINIQEEYADIVLSTQVLEHVDDPVFYLQESKRILKKDGLLILTTHGYWIYHPDPNDYWRWTSTGLKKIVEKEGFEVIRFRGVLGRAAMGLQLFQDGVLFKLPKWLRYPFSFMIQPWIWLFDKIHSQKQKDEDACTFILVARKK